MDQNKRIQELIFSIQLYDLYSKDLNLEVLEDYLKRLNGLHQFVHKHNLNSNNNLLQHVDAEISETKFKIKQIQKNPVLLIFNNVSQKGRRNEHLLNFIVYRMSLLFKNGEDIDWKKMYQTLNSHPTLQGFFKKKITSFHNESLTKDTLRKKKKSWENLSKKHKS